MGKDPLRDFFSRLLASMVLATFFLALVWCIAWLIATFPTGSSCP